MRVATPTREGFVAEQTIPATTQLHQRMEDTLKHIQQQLAVSYRA